MVVSMRKETFDCTDFFIEKELYDSLYKAFSDFRDNMQFKKLDKISSEVIDVINNVKNQNAISTEKKINICSTYDFRTYSFSSNKFFQLSYVDKKFNNNYKIFVQYEDFKQNIKISRIYMLLSKEKFSNSSLKRVNTFCDYISIETNDNYKQKKYIKDRINNISSAKFFFANGDIRSIIEYEPIDNNIDWVNHTLINHTYEIIFNKKREIIYECFLQNSYISRDDGPAFYIKHGKKTTIGYCKHGFLHREDGPALIVKNKDKISETYYLNGICHSVYQPTSIIKNLENTKEFYVYSNEPVSKENWNLLRKGSIIQENLNNMANCSFGL